MAPRRQYRNPPIQEAVVDVQVVPCAPLPDHAFGMLEDSERANYSTIKPLHGLEGVFHAPIPAAGLQPVLSSSIESEIIGRVMSNSDRTQVFQARRDGFAFSRLHPYTAWEEVRREASRLWATYRRVVQPISIRRVALRYVNRLDLPLPVGDVRQYLRTHAELAPELNQTVSRFFLQVQVPYPSVRATLNLTEAIVPPFKAGTAAIVLDIDLWSSEPIQDEGDVLWQRFDELHACKNEIFEACITDAARRLFE